MKHKSYKLYSYDEWKMAVELLNQGYGLTEVCRILGWSVTRKSSLHYWKSGKHRPPAARWIPKPSNELAYILGVLNGDGSTVRMHHYNYDVELLVKDYEFAVEFSKAVAKLLNKKYKKPRWSESHNKWRVTYSSKAFYIWYKQQTLETLKPYIEHDKKTIASYLRGLYDSDGYNYRCKQIFLLSNNEELLHYVQYLLKKYFNIIATGPYLNTKAGSISKKKNGEEIKTNYDIYQITINRKQHVARFLSEVGFSIREKQLGLPRRKK